MKHRLVSSTGSKRLLLIYAGWGMDDNVFDSVTRSGYDVMVVWDYRDFHIDWSCTSPYSEVCLLAWSLGVYAATQSTHAIDHKITRRVAVNGTPSPIDDRRGIPEAIYEGTLAALNEASLRKFYRRMCDDRDTYTRFQASMPGRSVDELRDELQAVADSLILNVPATGRWDLAVVAKNDRIFPPRNQRQAWEEADVTIINVDGGHYLDFQAIADRHFIDKGTMQRRFRDNLSTYDSNAVVQREVIDAMLDSAESTGIRRLLRRPHCHVLEIGSGSGILTRRISALLPPDARLDLWDIAADLPHGIHPSARLTCCDAELQLPRTAAESYDAVFSASTMQWFNSPEAFMRGCYRVLRPGGRAMLSTYTRGNMSQISELTGCSLPLETPEALMHMAREAGFVVEEADAYSRDLDFESPLEILRHLKLTGVNSVAGTAHSHSVAIDIMRHYPMMLDGRYHLTYHPMILNLRK